MWLTTILLIKVDIIINEKKQLQKLSTHSIEATEFQVGSKNKPGSSKFISFLLLIDKFNHFK